MPNNIQVEGLKELQAGLKQLDGAMAKELNAVAKSSAEVVAATARQLVPRRTGRLANSIKASGTQTGGFVKSGGLPYHRVIHFGWAKHHIKPQPFLYDALDERRDEVIVKFGLEVAALVEKSIPTKVV